MGAAEHNLEAWVSRLGSLTTAVNADYDLHALLDLVADAARDLLGLDLCGVMMPSAEGDSLDIVGASGLPKEYVERVNIEHRVRIESLATEGAPASRAFLSGEPCAVSDIHQEPVSGWVQTAREQGYRSILAVPLRTSAGILGTLNSYRNFAHTFAPEEVEQLMLLAEHAAIAVTSTRIRDDLRAQHELILRSEEIHSKMLDVAVLSGGVDGIAAVLGGLFTCDVVIREANGEILGSFTHPGPDRVDQGTTSTQVGPDLRELGNRGLVHQEGPHVVVNVVLDHSVVATAWLLDMAGRLDALGVRAAEHASVVLSLEFLRQRTAAEAEQGVRGELLTDLLAGVDPGLPQIKERAKLLGHDLSKPHRLLVAAACGPSRNTSRREHGTATHDDERAIHRAAAAAVRLTSYTRPRPLIAAVRDLVVALWPTDLDKPAGEETLQRAVLGHAASRALVMTSDLEDGIAETHMAVAGALRLALAGGSNGGVMTLDDLGAAGLLLRYAEPAHLQRYADRTLGAVTRYDARHGSELLRTLRTYLDCDLDRAATAERLTVHVNTVSQRLRRIEALSGLSLRSPRQVIDARTALMLMQIAGNSAP
ncbi:helix-turn-helix domain-containing protein [Rhodococcus rhodochrous]|uniref:Helix-turn-helix domain-containing protein n=1 Tax=Rhodococcus rhodochrous TaxID=1829 RepID=A0AAW4XP65_RHORH|nr:helix-turn-helix domain-containing protein [Rhodococcus rhodochrous]MCD2114868.1 helix-turn-helix domain-containing protein [Rhodococcus rhodochrous]